MPYCIYLRKSRADVEAESRGEGETLARHQRTLIDLAARMGLDISHIYREIVSGDSIAARPQMQQLLSDLRHGKWTGVLCMEVERLARGDTIDQGTVARTFKYSGAKIITPVKVYDPSDEADEEFFEFSLFMSRREYKTIKRRLQAGRRASVREGHYCGSIAPYGYTRVRLPRGEGWTLAPDPSSADTVRMIFNWAARGADDTGIPLGAGAIATRLNNMNLPTRRGCRWSQTAVRDLLKNPVYIGYVTWDSHTFTRRIMDDGSTKTVRHKGANPIQVRGLHDPIIPRTLFDAVQLNVSARPRPRVHDGKSISNPFAGLVRCAECGHTLRMVRSGAVKDYYLLSCPTTGCPTSGISVQRMEQAIMETLDGWIDICNTPPKPELDEERVARAAERISLESQLTQADNQRARLHDLLEQGVYDIPTYLERSKALSGRITGIEAKLAELARHQDEPTRQDSIRALADTIINVRTAYACAPTAAAKNELLKSVISKVIYKKTRRGNARLDPTALAKLDVYPARRLV